MQLNPYLTFNGQCETAFRFYEKCLGAKIDAIFPWEGTPAAKHVPADWGSKVMHATLSLGGQELMGVDVPPDGYKKPQGFSVTLGFKDAAEAERAFHALAEGAIILMPIQETFWAVRFGTLVDRFGIPWMINCGKPPERQQ